MIRPLVNETVTILTQKQVPRFFQSLAKQIEIPLNCSRIKTGVIAKKLVGIDDTGRFISSKRELLPNGDWGTISQVGKVEGVASKIVPQKDIATMTITKRS